VDKAGATGQTLSIETQSGGPVRQALLRFDGLFGTGPGQIPPGATVTAASLELWVNAPADATVPIELHRMIAAWDPAVTTWKAFSRNGQPGVQADGVEAAVTADGAVTAPVATGF
jgi:hypothetical protein